MNHKATNRLYNVIFPVWFLYFIPNAWIYTLPLNFIIDSLVCVISMKLLEIEDQKEFYKSTILKIWGFGFLADIIGALLLLLYLIAFDNLQAFEPILTALTLNPFTNIFAFLLTLVAIAFAGYLIYLFNYRVSFKGVGLDDKKRHKIALWFAIFTAPYTFLIPIQLFL